MHGYFKMEGFEKKSNISPHHISEPIFQHSVAVELISYNFSQNCTKIIK